MGGVDPPPHAGIDLGGGRDEGAAGVDAAPDAGIDLVGGMDEGAVGVDAALPAFASEAEVAQAKAAAQAAIDAFYRDNGGVRGELGFPLADMVFTGGTASRRYSGGTIRFLDNTPSKVEKTWVRVRYLGFHCLAESDWDQASPADEPYFIVGVAGANTSNTRRFGPYENVDEGDVRLEAELVASESQMITPPIVLGVVGVENDYGTPAEAEAKVRAVVEAIERKFDQAAGSFAGASAGSHVMPEWAREILIGWIPEGIAAVFGLGDDAIGKAPIVLFDHTAELLTWTEPPILGKHGQHEYNLVVPVGGEGEGTYNLFFKVDLVKTSQVEQ